MTFEFTACRGRKVHAHTDTLTPENCLPCHVLSATEQFCWSSWRFSALLKGILVIVGGGGGVIVGQKCAFIYFPG